MRLFSMLKKNAKLALKKNWGGAILIFLIVFGVAIMLSILQQVVITVFADGAVIDKTVFDFLIDPSKGAPDAMIIQNMAVEWIIIGVFSVLSLLFVAPLSLGEMRWFLKLIHGERIQVAEVFHFFESGRNFGRTVWYHINIYVRTFLWGIPIFAVPGGILGVSVYFLSTGGEEAQRSSAAIASAGIFLAAILMILASIFYAACVNRYALASYLLAESDEITVRKAIRDSVKYTKGFRFSLLWFELSYIGWFLLCVLALPLLLYVMPYYNTAYTMYARYIVERNRYSEPNLTKEFVASSGDSVLPETPAPEPEQPEEDGGISE